MNESRTHREEIVRKYNNSIMTNVINRGAATEIVIERAEGLSIIDMNGRKYLDCMSGVTVTNLGHSRPEIVEAIKDQVERFAHCFSSFFYTEPVAELADLLTSIAPGQLKKVAFVNTGAEAAEGAMQLSIKSTKQYNFIAIKGGYHGLTAGARAITGYPKYSSLLLTRPLPKSVLFVPTPYCYRCSLNLEYPDCRVACAEKVEDAIQEQSYDGLCRTAAFFAEPVMGVAGCIVPPLEYHKKVKSITDHYGVLYVADCVQSAFGRTGSMFGVEDYGIEPQVMILAKALGGGLPLGAILAKEQIAASFEQGDIGPTFGGNPVSCAAALAFIDVLLKEHLPEKAQELGSYFISRLKELQELYPLMGDVRGKGLFIGVEFVKDRKTKEPAPDEALRLRQIGLKEGVILGAVGGMSGSTMRLLPPLTITKEEVDRVLEVFENGLKQL